MTYNTLQSAYEQLKAMTEYMKAGESRDDTDPWNSSPFTQINKLIGYGETKNELARENAERIRDKLLRDGEISSDEAVKEAMNPLAGPESRLVAYYMNAGPVAATADNLRWNTAFRIDLSEAPEYGSDAYFTAAEQLSIPDTSHNELVPKKVETCYKALQERTERNGGNRVIHPEELRSVGPRLNDRLAERAFDYLEELPGVEPPAGSGPAWEKIEESELSDTYEQGSKSGNAEMTG